MMKNTRRFAVIMAAAMMVGSVPVCAAEDAVCGEAVSYMASSVNVDEGYEPDEEFLYDDEDFTGNISWDDEDVCNDDFLCDYDVEEEDVYMDEYWDSETESEGICLDSANASEEYGFDASEETGDEDETVVSMEYVTFFQSLVRRMRLLF